jgi:hypothetical protein
MTGCLGNEESDNCVMLLSLRGKDTKPYSAMTDMSAILNCYLQLHPLVKPKLHGQQWELHTRMLHSLKIQIRF